MSPAAKFLEKDIIPLQDVLEYSMLLPAGKVFEAASGELIL